MNGDNDMRIDTMPHKRVLAIMVDETGKVSVDVSEFEPFEVLGLLEAVGVSVRMDIAALADHQHDCEHDEEP